MAMRARLAAFAAMTAATAVAHVTRKVGAFAAATRALAANKGGRGVSAELAVRGARQADLVALFPVVFAVEPLAILVTIFLAVGVGSLEFGTQAKERHAAGAKDAAKPPDGLTAGYTARQRFGNFIK
jgi:hypothetical protein